MIRPIRAETMRYGEYSKPGEFVYDHPVPVGLAAHRARPRGASGGKYPHLWHVRHMEDPRSITPQSIMPAYPWLLEAADRLGRPRARREGAGEPGRAVHARTRWSDRPASRATRRRASPREIAQQGGPSGLEDTELVALIAYLQRLGTDIKRPRRRRRSAPALAAAPRPLSMSLADVMSAMRLHLFAEAALLLASASFVTVLVSVFLRRNRAPFERARLDAARGRRRAATGRPGTIPAARGGAAR